MKSLKNHFSLILALFSILFTMHIFFLVERVITAYENELHANYSVIVITSETTTKDDFQSYDSIISHSESISADNVLNELKGELKEKNFNLLKLTLPKFYRIYFTHYPSPDELETLQATLLKQNAISKVETFSNSHDTVYNLLLLFKSVTLVLALAIVIITILLIFKELRIWQFQHNERMQIMALFGAPVWLRSAVLFRLAIVDAIIASALVFITFVLLDDNGIINQKLRLLNVKIDLFHLVDDGIKIITVAFVLAISLAFMVMLGSKDEQR